TLNDGTPAAAIDGMPTVAGSYDFTVQVEDSAGNTATRAFALDVAYPALVINTTTLPDADSGVTYTTFITATGGDGTYTWMLLSTLPTGFNFVSGTHSAMIAGTTEDAAVYAVSVEV